jgi:glyceraldehyde-3-phosphate dehydrogenase (NADP+)
VRPDMRIAWEEPFGPVLPVIRIKTIEEGIHHCNANNFALQVCILFFPTFERVRHLYSP